jgi:hypothetical protein
MGLFSPRCGPVEKDGRSDEVNQGSFGRFICVQQWRFFGEPSEGFVACEQGLKLEMRVQPFCFLFVPKSNRSLEGGLFQTNNLDNDDNEKADN